jgi:superfamily II DNA/RNA helicase
VNWQDYRIRYLISSSDLAAFDLNDDDSEPDPLAYLAHWLAASPSHNLTPGTPQGWLGFAAEVHYKILSRGRKAFPQWEIEETIRDCFFSASDFTQQVQSPEMWTASRPLQERRKAFIEIGREVPVPCDSFNPLDPENPQNEMRLLRLLYRVAGYQIGAFLHPQVPLDLFSDSLSFGSQRADFVLTLPNGKGLVLEPGDHGSEQELRDTQRDKYFSDHLGYKTLRPTNNEIDDPSFELTLRDALSEIEAAPFLSRCSVQREIEGTGFLAAHLIHRIEFCLVEQLLCTELWDQDQVTLRVIERDLPVAGLALASFLLQQQKLHALYGKSLSHPRIDLFIHYSGTRDLVIRQEAELLNQWNVTIHSVPDLPASIDGDLILDVAVTAGTLLTPFTGSTRGPLLVVRNAPPHNTPVVIPSNAQPFDADGTEDLEERLLPFLRDFFRFSAFQSGQGELIHNILGNRDTIGLLPTSAGKSLCYQLTSLLRPGTTLVICPIIALMDDQAEGLRFRHRIDAVKAIHSGGNALTSEELRAALQSSCFVFIAPERLQRQSFRDALRDATILDSQRISLVVIDEAHCVSMWGHDFRPAYLRLPANLRHYCRSSSGRPPPLVALTGTASQLVLIDLKRILGIVSQDDVIRPKSFARKELSFRVIQCPMGKDAKAKVLIKKVFPEIESRLKIRRLLTESCGIIFDFVPKNLWRLIREISPDYQAALTRFGETEAWKEIPIGIYTGKCPMVSDENDDSASLATHWDNYKKESFKRFARGQINCLFGNSAVSVGIDNPRVRYVVNLSMPQSMEDYYQQAGRAGRNRDKSLSSYSYLLYSEAKPRENDLWFLGKGQPEPFSDVDSAVYFHKQNFPGIDTDAAALVLVLNTLMRIHKEEKSRTVRYDQKKLQDRDKKCVLDVDATQRFVGYLILVGVVEDYTLKGMNRGAEIHAELNEKFAECLENEDWPAAESHVEQSLLDYYRRYYPKRLDELRDEITVIRKEKNREKYLTAACTHLVNFIYSKIAYQRRKAIKDITEFCRQAQGDEQKASTIIRDYFDTSRFSPDLLEMREVEPDFERAVEMLASISEHGEAEQLFWETGRLLSETQRADWQLIHSSARIYLNTRIDLAEAELQAAIVEHGEPFTLGLIKVCERMSSLTSEPTWKERLENVILSCYADQNLKSLVISVVSDPGFPASMNATLSEVIAARQIHNLYEHLDQFNP